MIKKNIEETLERFGPLGLKDLTVAIGEHTDTVLESLAELAAEQKVQTVLVEESSSCSGCGCGSCGPSEPSTQYAILT